MSKINKSTVLANRVQEVLLDGKWIANTNYKEQIFSVDFHLANQSIHNLNSIAILTYHINYYLKGLNECFKTGDLTIQDKFSFDMSPLKTEDQWHSLRKEFVSNAEIFVHHVKSMNPQKLDDVFVKEQYGTYSRNIEGMIEHAYYHLGQISLIKKLLRNKI
ncbi:MAG: DUF1572 family protein [Crocinitomicaceae bacterium]|nr:DUF1572 family protein [Crocinitomicaceae bacterium]